jgi:DNA replication protein DnaC
MFEMMFGKVAVALSSSPVPTLADAILDRLVHNAYRIELSGESLRKRQSS